MKYKVLDSLKAQTTQGEMELQPGQVIALPHDKAIRLLNEGKITPIDKIAFKVWSEILQAYLWIVDTDEDMHSLRYQGISGAIYTHHEIKELKKLSKDDLKATHKVKEVFPGSTIEEVNGYGKR